MLPGTRRARHCFNNVQRITIIMATKNTAPADKNAPVTAPAPKIALREANGITEPRPGSKTRRVWDIANELGAAKGTAPTIAEVKEKAAAEGLNDATIQTQYNRWRKFYNLPPVGRAAKTAAPAEPAKPAEAPAA